MSTWLGVGIGSKNSKGDWLEVYYPRELINPSEEIIVKTKESYSPYSTRTKR